MTFRCVTVKFQPNILTLEDSNFPQFQFNCRHLGLFCYQIAHTPHGHWCRVNRKLRLNEAWSIPWALGQPLLWCCQKSIWLNICQGQTHTKVKYNITKKKEKVRSPKGKLQNRDFSYLFDLIGHEWRERDFRIFFGCTCRLRATYNYFPLGLRLCFASFTLTDTGTFQIVRSGQPGIRILAIPVTVSDMIKCHPAHQKNIYVS